jgi:hypothetical protein
MKRVLLITILALAMFGLMAGVALAADDGGNAVYDANGTFLYYYTPATDNASAVEVRMETTHEQYNFDTGQFLPADPNALQEPEDVALYWRVPGR